MAAYVGSFALFFLSYPVTLFLYVSRLVKPNVALLFDPIGVLAIMNEMMSNWTIVEKNIRMFALEGPMLANRLLWMGISVLTIAYIYGRYRFAHRTETDLLTRLLRRFQGKTATPDTHATRIAVVVPEVPQSLGFGTYVRQTVAIARVSFSLIARSLPGLFLRLKGGGFEDGAEGDQLLAGLVHGRWTPASQGSALSITPPPRQTSPS